MKDEEKGDDFVTPVVDMITLTSFKDVSNMSDMEYAGFKAMLKAQDLDEFSKTDLDSKFEVYKNQSGFKIDLKK